jgi:hypothetical protein
MTGPEHYTEMFTSSDFTSPGIHWGYQCFTCHHEETGYATLALAEAAADQHVKAMPPLDPPQTLDEEPPGYSGGLAELGYEGDG